MGSTPRASTPKLNILRVSTRKASSPRASTRPVSTHRRMGRQGIFFLGIPSILGIIFGFVARSQIERSDGAQTGSGLALAGIIVGFCVVAIGILIVIFAIIGAHNGCDTNNNFGNC
jgi:hypothetical protein